MPTSSMIGIGLSYEPRTQRELNKEQILLKIF